MLKSMSEELAKSWAINIPKHQMLVILTEMHVLDKTKEGTW
jgi:hypothetical protein